MKTIGLIKTQSATKLILSLHSVLMSSIADNKLPLASILMKNGWAASNAYLDCLVLPICFSLTK